MDADILEYYNRGGEDTRLAGARIAALVEQAPQVMLVAQAGGRRLTNHHTAHNIHRTNDRE